MNLNEQFEKAAVDVKTLPSQSNQTLLSLYGLYKQATTGNADGKRPGLLQIRERAKFDAWAVLKDTPEESAKKLYIETVNKLLKN